MDTGLLVQYIVIALAVVASLAVVMHKQFPKATRDLRIAIALPLITLLTHQIGWRVTLGLFAVSMFLCALLLLRALPEKLFAAPVSLSTWVSVARNPFMLLVLLITVLQTSGQFHIFPYIQPLSSKLAGATPGEVSS